MTPRCAVKGCPVRFTHGGDDRLCTWHRADYGNDALPARMATFGMIMATQPNGEHDGETDGE